MLIATLAGMAAGAIMAFLSHIAPRFGAGNFIQDTDKPHAFGRGISRREAHLIGVFIHLLLSGVFGFGFGFLVEYGQFTGYEYIPMLIWCVAISLFLGLVVMPIEGHGVFGRKHDAWFMVDALLTNFLWGHLFLVLMRLWLVA
jgi:hypothetical protein